MGVKVDRITVELVLTNFYFRNTISLTQLYLPCSPPRCLLTITRLVGPDISLIRTRSHSLHFTGTWTESELNLCWTEPVLNCAWTEPEPFFYSRWCYDLFYIRLYYQTTTVSVKKCYFNLFLSFNFYWILRFLGNFITIYFRTIILGEIHRNRSWIIL